MKRCFEWAVMDKWIVGLDGLGKVTPDFRSQPSNNPLIHFPPLARGFVKKNRGGRADVE
jgi:hypothetical protein